MTEKDRRAAGRQSSGTLPQIDDLCRILHPLHAVRVVKELSRVWHYRSHRVLTATEEDKRLYHAVK